MGSVFLYCEVMWQFPRHATGKLDQRKRWRVAAAPEKLRAAAAAPADCPCVVACGPWTPDVGRIIACAGHYCDNSLLVNDRCVGQRSFDSIRLLMQQSDHIVSRIRQHIRPVACYKEVAAPMRRAAKLACRDCSAVHYFDCHADNFNVQGHSKCQSATSYILDTRV